MRHDPKLILTAVLTIALAACGGDDGTGPNIGPNNGTMTATVDGSAWTALQIAAVNNSGIVAISGSNAALLAIGFGFVGDTTGTYIIGPGFAANANVIDNQNSSSWSANSFQGSGTITVTTLTAAGASGTFSYTAPLATGSGTPATRVVTAGSFDITFP